MTIENCIALFNEVPKDRWKEMEIVVSANGSFFSPCACESGITKFSDVIFVDGKAGEKMDEVDEYEAFALLPHDFEKNLENEQAELAKAALN